MILSRVTCLSPQRVAQEASQCFTRSISCVKNLTHRFCFRFSFYQTECDNVTWELRDEKISMVLSAFFGFFFFFFAEEMNWTVGAGFGANTSRSIMKLSSLFLFREAAVYPFQMEFANQIGLEMADAFVRCFCDSNVYVCLHVWVHVGDCLDPLCVSININLVQSISLKQTWFCFII